MTPPPSEPPSLVRVLQPAGERRMFAQLHGNDAMTDVNIGKDSDILSILYVRGRPQTHSTHLEHSQLPEEGGGGVAHLWIRDVWSEHTPSHH